MKTPTPASAENSTSREEMIRERAYFLWLKQGLPAGNAWEHWFTAEAELQAPAHTGTPEKSPAEELSTHHSIRNTLASHASDPLHRFHDPAAGHDDRTNVIAGEARQRVRGRRH